MAYVRVHRLMTNIGSSAAADYVFGTRGGILLNISLIWRPRTYFDQGTSDEQEKLGPIHAIVGDSATSNTILGQALTGSDIVIPNNGRFDWEHPQRQGILDSLSVVEKLAFNSFNPMPIGVIKASLRILASYDPVLQVNHDLEIIADLVAFDSQIL